MSYFFVNLFVIQSPKPALGQIPADIYPFSFLLYPLTAAISFLELFDTSISIKASAKAIIRSNFHNSVPNLACDIFSEKLSFLSSAGISKHFIESFQLRLNIFLCIVGFNNFNLRLNQRRPADIYFIAYNVPVALVFRERQVRDHFIN